MLDFSVTDHQSQALQQRHPSRLERRQAQRCRELEMFIRENRKRQVQALRYLALIDRVLGGKAEEAMDAKTFQLCKVIAESTRLRRASSRARDQVPSRRVINPGNPVRGYA